MKTHIKLNERRKKLLIRQNVATFAKKNSVKLNWEYCIKKWDEMKIENLGKNKSK